MPQIVMSFAYAYLRPTEGAVIDLGTLAAAWGEGRVAPPSPSTLRVMLDPAADLASLTLILPPGVDGSCVGVSTTKRIGHVHLQGPVIGPPGVTSTRWFSRETYPMGLTFVGALHTWVVSA
jgi:hypothetical protein